MGKPRKGETRDEFNARMRPYHQMWRDRTREKRREYGRTWQRAKQGTIDPPTELPTGPCEICREAIELRCDHDHTTGLFRGWLCQRCNTGLGMFRDSPEHLQAAIGYLKKE